MQIARRAELFVRTLPGMRSESLTDDQVGVIAAKVRPMLRYLARLENRMKEQAFPDDDRLLVLVRQARRDLQNMHLELHYLSCDDIGRPVNPNDRRGLG